MRLIAGVPAHDVAAGAHRADRRRQPVDQRQRHTNRRERPNRRERRIGIPTPTLVSEDLVALAEVALTPTRQRPIDAHPAAVLATQRDRHELPRRANSAGTFLIPAVDPAEDAEPAHRAPVRIPGRRDRHIPAHQRPGLAKNVPTHHLAAGAEPTHMQPPRRHRRELPARQLETVPGRRGTPALPAVVPPTRQLPTSTHRAHVILSHRHVDEVPPRRRHQRRRRLPPTHQAAPHANPATEQPAETQRPEPATLKFPLRLPSAAEALHPPIATQPAHHRPTRVQRHDLPAQHPARRCRQTTTHIATQHPAANPLLDTVTGLLPTPVAGLRGASDDPVGAVAEGDGAVGGAGGGDHRCRDECGEPGGGSHGGQPAARVTLRSPWVAAPCRPWIRGRRRRRRMWCRSPRRAPGRRRGAPHTPCPHRSERRGAERRSALRAVQDLVADVGLGRRRHDEVAPLP